MISSLRGTVLHAESALVVIETGGVGLSVFVPGDVAHTAVVGEQLQLHTSLIVREDSLTLFGFADEDERQMFELVQTASGVGPKLAQAMLAVHRPETLRRAVTGDDVRTLTTVPGIGQKGAQRIILELRDRIGPPGQPQATRTRGATSPGEWQSQVQAGLVGLGWSAKEADRAVAEVTPEAEQMTTPDVAALLRAALRTLSKA